MSPLPGQVLTFRDPGLGLSELSGSVFVLIGAAEKGDLNLVQAMSSPAAIADEYGEGPLGEAGATLLDIAGGPVYLCRVAGTAAGTTGSVTKTAQSSSTGTVAAAGAAYARYDVIAQVTKSGALGVAEFRYSLDGGKTWTDSLTVPSGGSYVIPRTNVTLTFTAGAGPIILEQGDSFAFTTTAPHYSTTELALGITALKTYLSSAPDFTPDVVVATGLNATGSAAATMFGALGVHLDGLEATQRYVRAIMDAGSADTRVNVKTAFASVAHRRISAVYGEIVQASSKPFAGFGAPQVPLLNAVAARAAKVLAPTDLARFADGPLTGVLKITHDEFVNEEMDAARITTARSWPGTAGFYLTNARLKSPTGSDYVYFQHGRVMDVASRVTVAAQQQFVNAELRTRAGGRLEESEAKRIEETVRSSLDRALSQQNNASGRRGWVSDFAYTVDRQADVLSTQIVPTALAIEPLAYAKQLRTELGFALNVGA
jgi:Protein of unknown function (DUF2586)